MTDLLHAPISASALPRIIKCPASYQLGLGMPNPSNPAAERGTRIHLLADQLLHGRECDPPAEDAEALKIAEDYVQYVNELYQNKRGSMASEVDLTPALSKVHNLLGGTADAIVLCRDAIHVVDLKTGMGKVSPSSVQLKMYLLGAWHYFNCPEGVTLVAHIFQPFNNEIPVSYTVDQIKEFQTELLLIVEKATDPFTLPVASYEACKYCTAKPICPALKTLAVDHAKKDFSINENLSELPELLEIAETLQGWIDCVKAGAKEVLVSGGYIEGYKLQAGRKMRSIKNPVQVIAHFEGNQALYALKSIKELEDYGFEIPEDFITTTISAPSIKRIK